LTNVHLLGWKDYRILPKYVRAFDACIIPFVRTWLMDRVYPLKLQEYLAAGKPVVSTPLPDVLRFNGLVTTADKPEPFAVALDKSLSENDSKLISLRKEAASNNSWVKRAEAILSMLG
jgi:glycosyltransferase involved in cell wall biosynthesis